MFNDESLSEHLTWQNYLEKIHRSVSINDVRPQKRTVDGFFAWIADRQDVQKQINVWLNLLKDSKNQAVKDSQKAKYLKEQGNVFFRKKNYPASVENYTQSAKYALFDTKDFAIAIANRSAAFYHMCRFKECLQDIEMAVSCRYPHELSWKLHLRAAQCHLKLRQGKQAEKSLASLKMATENSREITGAMKETILKQVTDLSVVAEESQKRYETFPAPVTENTEEFLQKMISKNLTFPFASTSVILKESPAKGRHVVAEKYITKGDVLFIEEPFAWVPVTHGNNVTLCAHCCGDLDDALFPCRGCIEAVYCCADCWNYSWTYHQWECPGYHIGLWQQIGVSHLAFKIFSSSVATFDEIWFNDVQRLVTNVDIRSIDDIFGIAIGSLMVTTYLEKFTNFFNRVDLKSCLVDKFTDDGLNFDFDVTTKKGKKLYVGSMILRHSLQMLANAYAVTRLVETGNNRSSEIMVESQTRIAAGAYPSAAMMNHSCDPDVIHTFWKNWIIIKAVKDIPEGQEIFNCYGPYFKRMPKAERQRDLLSQYCFHCKCSACTNPLFDHYTERFDGLKCPKCSGSALYSRLGEIQRCFDCGATSKVSCAEALQRATELYDKAIDLTDIDKWQEAIPSFEKSLAIREKHLYKHNEDVAITLDALGKSYGSTNRWIKSIWYLEKSLLAIEERYGADSIEVANELNKITDVGLHYLRQRSSRMKPEYRETYMKTKKQIDRALEIFSLTGIPLNEKYNEMSNKKDQLSEMMDKLRL